jgi:hypothetical protein
MGDVVVPFKNADKISQFAYGKPNTCKKNWKKGSNKPAQSKLEKDSGP